MEPGSSARSTGRAGSIQHSAGTMWMPCGSGLIHDASPGITAYFLTRDRDIEQTALQVVALGGRASPIGALKPSFGRFCQCGDPQGVPFGLHEADPSL